MFNLLFLGVFLIIFLLISEYISKNIIRYINFNLIVFLFYFYLDDKAPIFSLGLGNLGILDLIFIISFIVFFFRIWEIKDIQKKRFILFSFILAVCEISTLIHTFLIESNISLSQYQINFGFIFQLLVFSTYDFRNNDIIKFVNSLKIYVAFTIVLGLLRLIGIVDMPAQVRFSEDWERIRYIVNYQSLYLLILLFIYITFNNELIKTKIDSIIIFFIGLFLILVPQRMIWVLIIITILIILIRYWDSVKKNKISITIAFIGMIFLFFIKISEIEYILETAFLNPIIHFEDSNAGSRYSDYFWTINELFLRGKLFLGFGINDIPIRYINKVRTYYPIHSYLFLKFYQGGLLLILAHSFFHFYLIKQSIRFFKIKHVELFFWIYILVFIYSMTTYGGVFLGFIFGLLISVINGTNKKEYTYIR